MISQILDDWVVPVLGRFAWGVVDGITDRCCTATTWLQQTWNRLARVEHCPDTGSALQWGIGVGTLQVVVGVEPQSLVSASHFVFWHRGAGAAAHDLRRRRRRRHWSLGPGRLVRRHLWVCSAVLERRADGAVRPVAVLPVGDDLAQGSTVLNYKRQKNKRCTYSRFALSRKSRKTAAKLGNSLLTFGWSTQSQICHRVKTHGKIITR